MQRITTKRVQTVIKKILGSGYPMEYAGLNKVREFEIASWEKLLIANRVESKFGITINDEKLNKADTIEEIINTILSSKM